MKFWRYHKACGGTALSAWLEHEHTEFTWKRCVQPAARSVSQPYCGDRFQSRSMVCGSMLSLALVAYHKIRLINSIVFACFSVVCPVSVALLQLWP